MQPEQGPRRDPARPPAPLGAPGSGRARANSPERSGTTPQGWKLEPGFSCVAPHGPSPLPWLPAAPRAWAALCGRCVRRQPTCPPAQASASGPRAAAAPSASQGSGPLTAGAPGTRVLADQPRPRRDSLRSGPERELAARGRGRGAPPHRPEPGVGGGGFSQRVGEPPPLPPPVRVRGPAAPRDLSGAAAPQEAGGRPSSLHPPGCREQPGSRGKAEAPAVRWEPLGVVASPAAEGPGRRAGRRRLDRHTASGVHQKDRAPACSPEPARHQGLVTETTLGRAWHL